MCLPSILRADLISALGSVHKTPFPLTKALTSLFHEARFPQWVVVSLLAKWMLSLRKYHLKKGNYLVRRACWLKHSQLCLLFSAELGREGGQGWTLTVPHTSMIPKQSKSSSFPVHLWNHGPQSTGQKWSIHREWRKKDIPKTIQDLKISGSTSCRGKRNQGLCVYSMCSVFASLGIKVISLVLHKRNSFEFHFCLVEPFF